MGIIRKQSINNSINLYLGIVIGAINTILIFPHVFESNPEYWGLLQILVSYSIIFSTFSHIGSPHILLRFFPKVKDKGDLFSFSLVLCICGFLLFLILFYLFKSYLLLFLDASPLLKEHFFLVGVLVFSISFFDFFSSISRSYFDSSTPVFLNEVFLRICVLILLALYKFGIFTFNQFLYLYVALYFTKFIVLLLIQWKNKRLSFSFNFSVSVLKEQFKYGLYVLTGGGAAVLVSRFDMLMIEHYLDLKQVAYYGLAFFIGSVIKVPSRSISSISSPLIAKSFEENNRSNIQSIYSKTSINLLIIGGVIFLCVLLNVDDILQILPEKYSHGKYVILFIGCAQLVNLIAGLHALILVHSPYYRSIVFFNIFLFLITFTTNVIFIPKFGINGAALATLVSIFIFNSVRMLYVYKKMNFHPFSSKTLIAVITIVAIYCIVGFIPLTTISILNIVLRCIMACCLLMFAVHSFKLSDDIMHLVNSSLNKFLKK